MSGPTEKSPLCPACAGAIKRDWRSIRDSLTETLTPFLRYNEEDAPEAADACIAVLKEKLGV